MHHYVYYSFEEYGRGYIGSRSCKCEPEKDTRYFGSFRDKTFRPTQKIILATYETREEALRAEISLHEFYQVHENPHFANRAKQTSTAFILCGDDAVRVGNKSKELGLGIHAQTIEEKRELGLKVKELGLGIHGMTEEERKENSIRGGNKVKELGLGIYGMTEEKRKEANIKGGRMALELGMGFYAMTKEELKEARSKGGNLAKEMGVGIHAQTIEDRRRHGKRGGKLSHEMGLGAHGLTKEEKSRLGKTTSSQRWQCTVTGFITNPGNLTRYQRARNINTSNRIRLS